LLSYYFDEVCLLSVRLLEVEAMNEHIVAGGCTTPPREVSVRPFVAQLLPVGLYVGAVAITGLLLSLLAVVLCGPLIGPGERFESVGLAWAGTQPFILVSSVLSVWLYRRYRARKHWFTVALFFVANAVLVSGVAALLWWLTLAKVLRW
jgi:hypothetical protein